MRHIHLIFLILFFCVVHNSWAFPPFHREIKLYDTFGPYYGPEQLALDRRSAILNLTPDNTIVLVDNTVVNLVGIDIPEPEMARRFLHREFHQQPVRVYVKSLFGEGRYNRHQQLLAHVVRLDGFWAQGELLKQGLARVSTSIFHRELSEPMLAYEELAREQRLGIWSDSKYEVRTPTTLVYDLNSFQIIEGRVFAVSVNEAGRIYLNFGQDWKTDLTITLAPDLVRDFKRAGLDLVSWAGRTIRVRGYVREYNGPMIELTHPEQIMLLD